MPYAIRIHQHGGPEVLQWEAVDIGAPKPDEVLIRHTAVGLNFYDVYERTGLYQANLPLTPGREAAGIVEAVGSNVRYISSGDRVAYVANTSGAYSEQRLVPGDRVVRLPEGISDQVAAAVLLKGLTAQMLVRQLYRVRRNDYVLVHAAAGGVGSLVVSWAKHIGARVLALVGSESKVEHVKQLGADQVLLTDADWVAAAREFGAKAGMHVVYDSVGKDTFMRSLDCLRLRGMMVTYGNSSGPVPPVAPLELAKRGSLFLTRPTMFDYVRTRSALVKAVQELFELVQSNVIKVHIGQTFPLRDAAQAHRALESRNTTGSTILLP
jgi:NADPH:quinone reductase